MQPAMMAGGALGGIGAGRRRRKMVFTSVRVGAGGRVAAGVGIGSGAGAAGGVGIVEARIRGWGGATEGGAVDREGSSVAEIVGDEVVDLTRPVRTCICSSMRGDGYTPDMSVVSLTLLGRTEKQPKVEWCRE
jgi:hypothetical protein